MYGSYYILLLYPSVRASHHHRHSPPLPLLPLRCPAIERLPDEEGLRRLATEWAPSLKKLGRLRDQLGGALPGRDALEAVLATLGDLIAGNESLREAAEPLIEGLEQLLR